VGWALGPEGQKLVEAVGYYPLPKGASALSEGSKGSSAQKAAGTNK